MALGVLLSTFTLSLEWTQRLAYVIPVGVIMRFSLHLSLRLLKDTEDCQIT